MDDPRLDRARPFGTIHPAYNGAQFEQDGCFFDGSGQYLFRAGEAAQKPNAGQAAGAQAPASPMSETKEGEEANDDPQDQLKAWARGEVNIPFFNVKKLAASVAPGIDMKNAKAVLAGLIKAGVIAPEDAKR